MPCREFRQGIFYGDRQSVIVHILYQTKVIFLCRVPKL